MRNRSLLVIAALIIIALLVISSIVYYFYVYLPGISTPTITFNSTPQVAPYVTEYPTLSNETSPNGIAVDSHGNVWFGVENGSMLAELIPSNGTIHEYHIPLSSTVGGAVIWGIASETSRNLVWFTETQSNAIWSFNTVTKMFEKHLIPTAGAFPFGIAVDQQGNVWFTELFQNKIGEVSPSGNVSEFTVPLTAPYGIEPAGITVDGSGRVWFTLSQVDEIGSYYQGNFQLYNLTGLLVSPVAISSDSHGNLWITQHGPSFISEFNPVTHYFRTVATSIPALNTSLPYFDYVDSHGNVWFNEHYGNAIGVFNPQNETLVEYEVPTKFAYAGDISGIQTMALSPKGQPWFTELFSGKVGTVNISRPVNLSIEIKNYTAQNILIANGSSATLSLAIDDGYSSPATLKGSVGNFTGVLVGLSSALPPSSVSGNATNSSFSFDFTPLSQTGNFSATATITNNGEKSGVYFVTISVATQEVVVSRVIEIVVP